VDEVVDRHWQKQRANSDVREGQAYDEKIRYVAKSTKELPKVPMTLATAQTTERIMASSLVKNVLRRGTDVVS